MKIRRLLTLVVMSFFLLVSCGSKPKKENYIVGIDPDWFGVDLIEKKVAVYGYCLELIDLFVKDSGLRISLQNSNWDALVDSVDRGIFSGVFSGLQPNVGTLPHYSFSEPVLLTGAVFVTADNSIKNIKDLKGRDLTIENGNELMLNYALSFENINLDYYDSYANAMYKLSQKELVGLLVPAMIAKTFEQNLYKDKIFIQSKPLVDEGIRFVTKKGHNQFLMQAFSAFLKKIEGKKYQALLDKWGLVLN